MRVCKRVKHLVQKLMPTSSIGVALTSCTVPAAGRPTLDIGETAIEMAVGIHGEPSRKQMPMTNANALVKNCIDAIVVDFSAKNLSIIAEVCC